MRHGRIPGAKNKNPAKSIQVTVRLTPDLYKRLEGKNKALYIRNLVEKDTQKTL